MNKMRLEIEGNPGENNTYNFAEDKSVHNTYPNANINYYPIGYKQPRALIITKIINALYERGIVDASSGELDILPYSITQKIDYNSLVRWKDDINDYALQAERVNEVYREYDKQGQNRSTYVFVWLKTRYRELKDLYQGDKLFDELLKLVTDTVGSDPSCKEELAMEEIEYHARIVLIDAFMKCKIFEKPIVNHVDS